MTQGKIVTVFGSSRPVAGDPEYQQAYDVGRLLAVEGIVVCTGGYDGVMEAAARGAKEASGAETLSGQQTIGIVARSFAGRSPNKWIDRVITVDSMIDRLLKLLSLGDAYVVLRGGTGTLLELAAVWELMNKKAMQEKPVIIVGSSWDPVITTVSDELRREGNRGAPNLIKIVATPPECVDDLRERFSDR